MNKELIPKVKDLWYHSTKGRQWWNCVEWLDMLEKAPFDTLFRPNEAHSPWHWMAIVSINGGEKAAQVSMWPHLAKWQIDSNKAQIGWDHLLHQIHLIRSQGDVQGREPV